MSIENIHGAEHIAASEKLGRIGSPALDVIRRILVFRGRSPVCSRLTWTPWTCTR
ncbi:hypothetical protein SALBM311S_01809 [Streptomyces alboniger]